MEKIITDLEGCEKKIEITLTAAEINPYYEQAFAKAQAEIELKGFRRGKAPKHLIRQMFGKRIRTEAQQDILSEIFFKITQEERIKIIGQPVLENAEEMANDGIKYTVTYETLPEFKLNEYKALTIDEPVHAVTDEEVQREIDKICTNNGNFEDAEQVTGNLFVVGLNLKEIDTESRLPLIGGEEKDINVYLADETVLPELRALLLDTCVGNSFAFNPKQSDKFAPDKTFQVTVNDIQKLIPVEFTNEFVESYTKGKFTTTDEFHQEIGFHLQEEWDHRSREAMENQISSVLINMHNFPLPEGLVWNVMERLLEDLKNQYKSVPGTDKLTIESMEKDLRPIAERTLRWELIRMKIIEIENIAVEDYDIDPIVEIEANRLHSDPAAVKKSLLGNTVITNNILAKKVMDFLLDFAITNEVPFDRDDESGHDHDYDYDDHDYDDHDHDHDHDQLSEETDNNSQDDTAKE